MISTQRSQLPRPSTDALAHSHQLLAQIIAEAPMSFQRFMQLALYAPGLGYYSAGCQKFGSKGGDFITAPEISPLFAECLAAQCQQVLASIEQADILEFGAGSGVLAADLLIRLDQLNCLPRHYYILDLSPDLQQRQQQTLAQRCPQLAERVIWLNQLPEQFNGIILANEVLDAMPVLRFQVAREKIYEYYVAWDGAQLQWQLNPLTDNDNLQIIRELQQNYFRDCEFYNSEINLLAKPWLKSVAASLQQGVILLIDYGFPAHEYYHPQRDQGTLMCHYQHHSHDNPLFLPGLQDITSHVNFTALADYAELCDLQLAGFTNQAAFLINCGLADIVANHLTNQQQMLQSNHAIKLLTLPSEMGELFKVMAFSKQFNDELLGFSRQDKRHSL